MLSQPISRRDFLLAGSVGGGALLAGVIGNRNRSTLPASVATPGTLVVAKRNGTVAEMVTQCVDTLGGMNSFVPSGAKVAIKVNGSWNNPSANTDTEVVRQVVLLVNAAGPSKVTVYDHTIDRGGWPAIASAAESAGAETKELRNDSADYISKTVPGVGLNSAMVAKVLDEADVLINVPILKTHSGGQVTIGLKNHLGTVLDRGAIHNGGGHGLHQGIADINACSTIRSKHQLTICDAIRPMVTGGPSSGTHAEYNGILAGTDPVATDYIGTQIIRRYNSSLPENPEHIQKAADLGLGTNDPTKITFDDPDDPIPVPEFGWSSAIAGLGAVMYLFQKFRPDLIPRNKQ